MSLVTTPKSLACLFIWQVSTKNIRTVEQLITHTQRELILQCIDGNRRAQYALYQQYAKAMLNLSYRMLQNREDAEDVLQEAFFEAFDKLHRFRFESTFGAWLKRIVINRCINALRRRKLPLQYLDDMQAFAGIPDEAPEETGLSVEQVKKAMTSLPSGSRTIFSLYLLEGYDHNEIAEILDISVSNSKTQYMRARQRVKEIIMQQGYAA
ncbi:MAG: RNA polymerase sigma factor [Bacteroidetes bacterium]|nr:RNA polymerase sigma factor [Bacteroidota bacterium]